MKSFIKLSTKVISIILIFLFFASIINGVEIAILTSYAEENSNSPDETGSISNRFVGILYSTWFNYAKQSQPSPLPVFDEAVGNTAFRYNAVPSLGKYLSDDKYVINDHADKLASAGIDFIAIDFSNNNMKGSLPSASAAEKSLYEPTISLLEEYLIRQSKGLETPKITFFIGANEINNTLNGLELFYKEIYDCKDSNGQFKYRSLLFNYDNAPANKPLLLVKLHNPNSNDNNIEWEKNSEFEIRYIWGLLSDTPSAQKHWSFMEFYPQPVAYYNDEPECIAVSAAQQQTYMSAPGARSRRWNSDLGSNEGDEGSNFNEQWSTVYSFMPKYVFIRGWNEWIAQNLDGNFTDNFNYLYSNDIEPVDLSSIIGEKPETSDFYYQLMATNIKKFKNEARMLTSNSDALTISESSSMKLNVKKIGDVSQFANIVEPEDYSEFSDADDNEENSTLPVYTLATAIAISSLRYGTKPKIYI